MKQFILVFIFSVFNFLAKAQDTIAVTKDPRLDVLVQKQELMNKRSALKLPNGKYKGYRVQVLITRSSEEAFRVKGELLERFPDQMAYAPYQSPYFKVRIGNFIKKADAEKFRKQLSAYYKNGLYLVEEGIDYKPSEDEDLFEDD